MSGPSVPEELSDLTISARYAISRRKLRQERNETLCPIWVLSDVIGSHDQARPDKVGSQIWPLGGSRLPCHSHGGTPCGKEAADSRRQARWVDVRGADTMRTLMPMDGITSHQGVGQHTPRQLSTDIP